MRFSSKSFCLVFCMLVIGTACLSIYMHRHTLQEVHYVRDFLIGQLRNAYKNKPTQKDPSTVSTTKDTGAKEMQKKHTRTIYQLYQPVEEVDFPTVEAHAPRIPHIIHQMYSSEMIPTIYTELVKSFIKNNPTWQYRFWTDSSGRKLLEKHHPYLLKVYDQFGNNVKRSDLLRYAVLYEYGGLYADLDVESLRSLNRSTIKYACVVSTEPFEHSVLLNNMDYLMNNAIMSCRAKHPFFKQLLQNLQHASPSGYPVGTTGPGYVTRQFNKYNKIASYHPVNKTDWTSNSPYFYKGNLKEDDINAVYVPNSQYFMDKVDPIHSRKDGKFTKMCSSIETLSTLKLKRACAEYHARKVVRENKKYTFTVHHWYHLWVKSKSAVTEMETIHIKDIVPNCVFYESENTTSTAHT